MRAAIDRTHLERYTAGDIALEREILGLFEQQTAIWIGLMTPDADDRQWRDAAHSLKGAARGVGAWVLAEICESAEQLGGADQSDADRGRQRQHIIDNMRIALDAAVDQARDWRSALSPEA